ncbi:hypothetical protein [Streptomyces tauricus]|uniref:hypothetical protein n=1 Tax=Streptomyces tauricus TaxID=68274 RepID=UPI00343CBEA2
MTVTGLLSVSGAALSADPRLLSSLRDIGTRPGIDFECTDDAATAELLERHRRRAHGVPVTHIPGWLVGRAMSGDRETVPIPVYEEVAALSAEVTSAGEPPEEVKPTSTAAAPPAAPATATVPATTSVSAAVPAKPASGASYEGTADEGGRHGDAGCLLLFVGLGGVIWAFSETNPLGHLTTALAAPWRSRPGSRAPARAASGNASGNRRWST